MRMCDRTDCYGFCINLSFPSNSCTEYITTAVGTLRLSVGLCSPEFRAPSTTRPPFLLSFCAQFLFPFPSVDTEWLFFFHTFRLFPLRNNRRFEGEGGEVSRWRIHEENHLTRYRENLPSFW